MVSPSEGVHGQLQGVVHNQLLGEGVHGPLMGGHNQPLGGHGQPLSLEVHGWLLGGSSQLVTSGSVYLDELALFIIVRKILVTRDQLF